MELVNVSVIIPTYNRSNLIAETLDSVLSQSFSPLEVIVIDDGSTDGTEEVVRRYGYHVSYIRIDNMGECRARNVGAAMAAGNWIAFCDSDDLWHSEKLAYQATLALENPDVEYSFTNFKHVVDGTWSATTKFDSLPADFWNISLRKSGHHRLVILEPLVSKLLKNQPIFPSTLMMKQSFFSASGGWNEALGRTPSVDLEYHLRCASSCHIGVVDKPLVGIRKHISNFSGDPLKTAVGEIAILKFVLANNIDAAKYHDEILEQIVVRSERAAHHAFARQDHSLAYRLLENVPSPRRSFKLRVKTLLAHLTP